MHRFLLFLIPVAALLAYTLWSRTRRNPVHFAIRPGVDFDSLMRSMAGLTWGRLTEGNRVEIVQNSGFFDALFEDVARARHSVHLETFLWEDGAISERVTDALAARGRDGIEVRVLVDQRGAKQISPTVAARLRAGGCNFRVYHRMRFREFGWYNHRDHRKIAVIDGRIGYTFGHGIADMWGGTPEEPSGWRDTAARFEGPIVNELQTAFFDNWTKVTGEAIGGREYFPKLERAGETPAHVAYLAPSETASAVQRLYYFAIAAAREEIILQNPYFLPSSQAMQLFAEARKRGVAISIMLPTATTSDFSIVQHASHYFYGPLLAMGARVWEHTRCGLHQKVMIIDRQWCSIGSTNFDPRSFRLNDEITVAMCDRDVAAELHRAFEEDLGGAEEWTLARFAARTWGHRWQDRVSALAKRQL
ncbi:MAG TPA: phospholipase D-like domain-containing protein [Thermoanaerobaculia bacterium]|nr:phospholipase D-like domain-containing protein [Thermoanaerobaculia bacterium]